MRECAFIINICYFSLLAQVFNYVAYKEREPTYEGRGRKREYTCMEKRETRGRTRVKEKGQEKREREYMGKGGGDEEIEYMCTREGKDGVYMGKRGGELKLVL